MNKKLMVGGCFTLVLFGLAAWRLGWFGHSKYSKDPAVAELQQLRDAGFAKQNQMSEADQKAARDSFRERIQKLTDEQRQAFFRSSAPMMMKMFEQQVDRFLAMSPEERLKEMDKRIDDMKAMQARGGGPPGGGFGGTPPSPEQMDQMRKRMLDASTPDQRAKFEQAMTMFTDRMKAKGMSPGLGGGFF
jgi:hypothetical protein